MISACHRLPVAAMPTYWSTQAHDFRGGDHQICRSDISFTAQAPLGLTPVPRPVGSPAPGYYWHGQYYPITPSYNGLDMHRDNAEYGTLKYPQYSNHSGYGASRGVKTHSKRVPFYQQREFPTRGPVHQTSSSPGRVHSVNPVPEVRAPVVKVTLAEKPAVLPHTPLRNEEVQTTVSPPVYTPVYATPAAKGDEPCHGFDPDDHLVIDLNPKPKQFEKGNIRSGKNRNRSKSTKRSTKPAVSIVCDTKCVTSEKRANDTSVSLDGHATKRHKVAADTTKPKSSKSQLKEIVPKPPSCSLKDVAQSLLPTESEKRISVTDAKQDLNTADHKIAKYGSPRHRVKAKRQLTPRLPELDLSREGACELQSVYSQLLQTRDFCKGHPPVKPVFLENQPLTWSSDRHGQPIKAGSGAYGTVFKANLAGTEVVVKLFHDRPGCNHVDEIFQEASIATYVNGTGAAPHCYGMVHIKNGNKFGFQEFGIVCKFLGEPGAKRGTQLGELMYNTDVAKDVDWKHISLLLCERLASLHQRNLVVNDIKADNILVHRVNDVWEPFFIDFGVSVYQASPYQYRHVRREDCPEFISKNPEQPPEYGAPHGTITPRCDVFNIGDMLYAIHEVTNLPLVYIATRCKKVSPLDRPTAAQLAHMVKRHLQL